MFAFVGWLVEHMFVFIANTQDSFDKFSIVVRMCYDGWHRSEER